jgi:hypothetical protein
MADNFGPITPPEPQEPEGGRHPIDDRLRQLARETEPLVVLAGAKAARQRGELRRTRRRAGAMSFVLAMVLAFGSWQLLPRLGTGSAQALPSGSSSPMPAGSPTGETPAELMARLTAALLPADVLRDATGWLWRPVSPPESGKFPEICPVRPTADVTATASRTYSSLVGSNGHYYVYALTSSAAAEKAEQLIRTQAAAKCNLLRMSRTDWMPDAATTLPSTETWESTKKGFPVSMWLSRSGRYLTVLMLNTSGNPQNGKHDSYYLAPPLGECINDSLDHLVAGTAPGSGATPDPSTAPAPGAGGDSAKTPPAGKDLYPTHTPC